MRDVFEASNIAPQDYDWYVSDIETSWTPSGFSLDDQSFTGDELAAFLHVYEVQFISAVFSAVPKGLRPIPGLLPRGLDIFGGRMPADCTGGAVLQGFPNVRLSEILCRLRVDC